MPDDIARPDSDILAASIAESLSKPLTEARGLPAAAYTDPGQFDREQERLFRGGWVGVAFSHDIPAPGDSIPMNVAGAEIVVLRDQEGQVRAFHNVCRHRAARVLQEPGKGLKALSCPYHSWTYGLDGCLKSAPMFEGPGKGPTGSLDGEAYGLLPVACHEWSDFIFVNLDGAAAPFADYIGYLDDRFAKFDLAHFPPYTHHELTLNANWKVVMEGVLEVYHEKFVHPKLDYRIGEKGEQTWIDALEGGTMGFIGILPDGEEDKPLGALPRVPGMPETGPAVPDIFLMFPSTSINVMEDHIVRTLWTPVSPTETHWRSCWYFAPDAADDPALRKVCDEAVAFWLEIRHEDAPLVEEVQAGLSAWHPTPRNTVFSPYWEAIVRHFQQQVVNGLR